MLKCGVERVSLILLILISGFSARAEMIADVRPTLDLSSGNGFVGQASVILGGTSGRIIPTRWLDAKLRPFTRSMEMVGLQFGVHQSDDILNVLLCKGTWNAVGKDFCRESMEELKTGPRFSALYGGIQTEIIEVLTREPRSMQIYLGGGVADVHSAYRPPSVLPYISVEAIYDWRWNLSARAGFFLSNLDNLENASMAVPTVSMEYRF